MRPVAPRPYTTDHLKADGNLGYLEFLLVLNKLWTDSHPDIPLIATGTRRQGNTETNPGVSPPLGTTFLYPVIVYRLELRKPHPAEPQKPKIREEIATNPEDVALFISAQRFQNVLTFTAITQMDPQRAEEIIEAFEDFMIEFQPVFKQLGISELVYARRNPDTEDERPGFGVTERSVTYLVTTEKIIKTTYAKLEKVTANLRVFLGQYNFLEQATPYSPLFTLEDDYQSATPNQ